MEICTNNKTMTSALCGYDALGRRIEARSFADGQLDAVRRYWYNDQWQVLTQGLWSQAYAGLALSRNYIYGNTIDEVLGFEWVVDGTPGARYYYLHDHLYSPAAMLTEWGVAERYEYDAYGRRSVMSAGFAHRSNSHYLSDLGLTGREIDALDLDAAATPRLQHMHYRHRDYSPKLGRFMQHDPLGIRPYVIVDGFLFSVPLVGHWGNNLYGYVEGSPVLYLDHDGLKRKVTYQECLETYQGRRQKAMSNLGNCLFDCGITIGEAGPAIIACSAFAAKCGPFAAACWSACGAATGIAGGACGIACGWEYYNTKKSATEAYDRCMEDAVLCENQ
ncbi:MAG: hypothetical protein GX298_00385 [Planctomycetes bacterium]|nr:hypothetical protein [Planctomycetota bacterium]